MSRNYSGQSSSYQNSNALTSDLLMIIDALKVKMDLVVDAIRAQDAKIQEINDAVLDILDLLEGEDSPEGLEGSPDDEHLSELPPRPR